MELHLPLLSVLAATMAATAAVLALAGTWWFGRRADAYSHLADTISELGAAGTRDRHAVAWLWFVPNGIAFALAAIGLGELAADDEARRSAFMLAFTGVGWIGAAAFPCDPGAPAIGTVRNVLHNLFGGGAYLAGAAGLIGVGRALEDTHVPLALAGSFGGPAVLVGLFLISVPGLPGRGLIQRVIETILHGWLLWATIALALG